METRNFRKTILIGFLLLLGFHLAPSNAKPLDEYTLRRLQNIAIIEADFDPITLSDMDNLKRELQAGGFDGIIVIPNSKPSNEISAPIQSRFHIIQDTVRDSSGIFYIDKSLRDSFTPENLSEQIETWIHEGNHKVRISILPAGIVGKDSSAVKKNLFEQPSFFYQAPKPDKQDFSALLAPDAEKFIWENGIYIAGDHPVQPIAVKQKWYRALINRLLISLGLAESMRDMRVEMVKNDSLKTFHADGKIYNLTRHLGAGMMGDVYLIEEDGKKFVLKIPHENALSIS